MWANAVHRGAGRSAPTCRVHACDPIGQAQFWTHAPGRGSESDLTIAASADSQPQGQRSAAGSHPPRGSPRPASAPGCAEPAVAAPPGGPLGLQRLLAPGPALPRARAHGTVRPTCLSPQRPLPGTAWETYQVTPGARPAAGAGTPPLLPPSRPSASSAGSKPPSYTLTPKSALPRVAPSPGTSEPGHQSSASLLPLWPSVRLPPQTELA